MTVAKRAQTAGVARAGAPSSAGTTKGIAKVSGHARRVWFRHPLKVLRQTMFGQGAKRIFTKQTTDVKKQLGR